MVEELVLLIFRHLHVFVVLLEVLLCLVVDIGLDLLEVLLAFFERSYQLCEVAFHVFKALELLFGGRLSSQRKGDSHVVLDIFLKLLLELLQC